MYDLAIIGGGPAGVSAGVYAARKRLKTNFITESFGGQSTESSGVENWIGTKKISGLDFGKALEEHLRSYTGDSVEVKVGARVTNISKSEGDFKIVTADNFYTAKTVLITTGSTRKKLGIPGAKEFENKGITYCASCDGPLFAGQDVAVVGGGNAGLETAAQLLAYAKSVTLIHRRSEFKGDAITLEKILANEKLTALTDTEPVEVHGDKFVSGMTVKNVKTGETMLLPVTGIFVEVGVIPNTDFAANIVELDEMKRIKADPRNQRTSVEGIWAAGDCTDELYHQNNIAAGDGVKALEDIYQWLMRQA